MLVVLRIGVVVESFCDVIKGGVAGLRGGPSVLGCGVVECGGKVDVPLGG